LAGVVGQPHEEPGEVGFFGVGLEADGVVQEFGIPAFEAVSNHRLADALPACFGHEAVSLLMVVTADVKPASGFLSQTGRSPP
jgi:hypothetical protein